MKHLKYYLGFLFLAITTQSFAQTDKETTAKIVTDKNYIFNANSALPLSSSEVNQILSRMSGGANGSYINLTGSQYDLVVTKDSIVAYLPYYGRSYNAPYNPTEGGIKFKSKDFTYTETKGKKGSYSIQIRTKDLRAENYQMILNISQNGYASLMVNGTNKQAINYNGFLSEAKQK
jgi:hypothetical protein